jgi:segregation and condensation protein B
MNEENIKFNKEEEIGALEALLFYYGEPIEIKKLGEILEKNLEEVNSLIEILRNKLEQDVSSGLKIITFLDKVQLVTKPSFNTLVKKIINNEVRNELTPAALETLAIIAYLGPVTRAQIDYIRGVNSAFILRNLLIRGIVERNLQKGKKNTYEYSITDQFLKHMGIGKIEELPDYEKYNKILNSFEIKEDEEKMGIVEVQKETSENL